MIAVLSFWKKIGFWFIFETNIFPEIYKVYYNIFTTENHHYFKTTGGILGWIELVYRGINFITPLIILRKKIERVMDYKIISLISMVIYATVLISLKSIYGHRLAMCFDFIHILYFAEAFKRKHYVNKMKKSCIYFTKFQLQQVAFLFLYFVSYIVIVFMKLGYHQVVPYSFFFMH